MYPKTRFIRHSAVAVLALLGVLALVGCSTQLSGASTTVTPPSVQTILQGIQQAKFTDTKFTLDFNGTYVRSSATGTGNGKITTTPKRGDVTLNITTSDQQQQIVVEEIVDDTTSALYAKATGLNLQNLPGFDGKWAKVALTSDLASLINVSQVLDYANLKNVKVVGADTVDGTPVWHLQGVGARNNEHITVDLYVTQDKYLPKKAVVSATGVLAGTFTLNFTAYNTGVSINLPPADQVENVQ